MFDLYTIKINSFQVFLWLAILINIAIAFADPGFYTSFLSTVFYMILVFRLFQQKPLAFLLFSPIIFLHFSVFISLNAIESGAFMKEVGRIGYPSAASAVYVLVVGMFLSVASSVFSATNLQQATLPARPDAARHKFLFQWAAIMVCGFVIIYLIGKGIVSGFPVLDKTDRFVYRRTEGDKLLLYFLNLKIVLVSFLGLSAANCLDRFAKLRHHLVFCLYIAVCFLFGDKFFTIISAAFYYLAVQVAFDPDVVKKQAGRFFLPVLLAIFASTSVTIFIYSGNGSLSIEQTSFLLFERFAEQGQLWFVAFNESASWLSFDIDEVKENFNSLFHIPAQDYVFDKRIGPFHFVYKYCPDKLLHSAIRNAGYVTPIMVFEAYMLELFGFIGLMVVVFITGSLLGLIGRIIIRVIYSGNPFNVLLPSYVLLQLYYLIVTGNISSLLGIGNFKAYAALFLLKLLIDYWIKYAQSGLSVQNSGPNQTIYKGNNT